MDAQPGFRCENRRRTEKNGVTWCFAIYGTVHVTCGEDNWGWNLTVQITKNPNEKTQQTWEFDLRSWEDIKQRLLFWPHAKAHFSQLRTLLFTNVMNQLAEKELALPYEATRAKIAQMYAQGFARIR